MSANGEPCCPLGEEGCHEGPCIGSRAWREAQGEIMDLPLGGGLTVGDVLVPADEALPTGTSRPYKVGSSSVTLLEGCALDGVPGKGRCARHGGPTNVEDCGMRAEAAQGGQVRHG